MPFYKAGHAPSTGIYALHPSNGTNQVSLLVPVIESQLWDVENMYPERLISDKFHTEPK